MLPEKTYTIYDNASGGYTIWWKRYDRYSGKFLKKSFSVDSKQSMIAWRRKLEFDGFKFVGKI